MRIPRDPGETGPVAFAETKDSVLSIRILRISRPVKNERILRDKFRACPQSVGELLLIRHGMVEAGVGLGESNQRRR